jgi:hypothetical protein
MLEFYPLRFVGFAPSSIVQLERSGAASARLSGFGCLLGTLLLLALSGCASAPGGGAGPGSTPTPANVEPPPPNVNLSGFPLAYRQGYSDGCASAGGTERKDSARFGSDGNYRTGWQDGLAVCRKR